MTVQVQAPGGSGWLTWGFKPLDWCVNKNASYPVYTQLLALGHYAGVKPRLFLALMKRFGDISAILGASVEDLQSIDDITDAMIAKVRSAADRLSEADSYARTMTQRDIALIGSLDEAYPQLLFELNDPPLLLFVRGKLPDGSAKRVALIGADEATAEGIELTSQVARRFADAEVQVLSSLKGGVAAAAHLACKTAGGRSYAVVEGGFDQLEGEGAMPLAIDIVQTGGVISEYAPEVEVAKAHKGEVNRLLVGLSQAVVVTEVYKDSGRTLDILQFCRDIGKLVFLVIDPFHGALADEKGLHAALDAGAIPLEGLDRVDDIVKALV